MDEQMFLSAAEVGKILGISRGKSYAVIKEMNKELEAKGFLTIAGKIPVEYFKERWYGTKKGAIV